MNAVMEALSDSKTKRRPAAPRLPADLEKLRERYLVEYPGELARVQRLSLLPVALRHLLTLRLEIGRGVGLPERYCALAERTARGGAGLDTVDRLVLAFARSVRQGKTAESTALLPELRQYFSESQVVELAVMVTQARAMAVMDAMMGGQTR